MVGISPFIPILSPLYIFVSLFLRFTVSPITARVALWLSLWRYVCCASARPRLKAVLGEGGHTAPGFLLKLGRAEGRH